MVSFLAETGILSSKGDAKKMMEAGSMSINKVKVKGLNVQLDESHLIKDKYILIRKGPSTYTLAIFE
jgi:tyrosyl-tRNA synthetase